MIEQIVKSISELPGWDTDVDEWAGHLMHEIAAAAVRGMREPTDEMVTAYYDAGPGAHAAWEAMIDAALKEMSENEAEE